MNRRCALLLVLCAATSRAQSDRPATSVVQFLHIVADLDQSLAFYHDQLGLELRGPAGEHKFTDNPSVADLYGVPGQQFRVAVVRIPGVTFGIELVQWGQAQKPKADADAGLGAVTLLLHVPKPTVTPKAIRYDPDGFPVKLEQSGGPGAELSVNVNDPRISATLYERLLGLGPDQIRFTPARRRPSRQIPFPTPGQGMVRLFVPAFDAVTESLTAAGFSVITTGGEPVTLPQGPRVIILRDPAGFFLQLMEAKK